MWTILYLLTPDFKTSKKGIDKRNKDAAHTTHQLLAAKKEPYEKAYLLRKYTEEFVRKKFRRTCRQKKTKGNRTKQKKEKGDIKVESNDSPKIPDRGETSDHPWPPFGGKNRKRFWEKCR